MSKTICFGVIAIFLTCSAAWYACTSHFNFGNLLVCGMAMAAWCYTIFHRQIDLFTASGLGLWLKFAFFAGVALFCVVVAGILWGQFGNKPSKKEEYLIVLGCAVHGDVPSAVLKHRLDAAYAYYQENVDVIVVVSGGQCSSEIMPEALVMRDDLIARGVPDTQIFAETKSTSTEENFRFSKQLLAENGYEITKETEIAYVTNGFHCMRAGLYAKREGFVNANAVSASMPWMQLLPCYLREVFAVVYYIVFKSPNTGFLKNMVGLLWM